LSTPSVTIGNSEVVTATISDNAVTTAKIAALAVTTAKIAALAVTSAELATNAVTTVKILDRNVTTTKIALLGVTSAELAADAVTTAKVLDNNVTLAKIVTAGANNTFLARSTTGAGNYEALNTATTGLGFYTGAGGEVIQGPGSGKGTTFTLNKMCGEITTDGAVLNAATIVSATWNNSLIAATDVVIINHKSGGTMGSYTINVACGAGTATLSIRNNTAGNLSDTLVLNFVVIKGVKT
jgi:hypothetical protein